MRSCVLGRAASALVYYMIQPMFFFSPNLPSSWNESDLLHLTPSSPDYALFANASKTATTPSSTTPGAAAATAGGFKVQAGLSYGVVAAAAVSAVFSSIF